MTTETHTTPACMFCHRSSVVELTAAERELIRTGIHPQCWTDNFGPGFD